MSPKRIQRKRTAGWKMPENKQSEKINWCKGHSDKAICISCGLKIRKKPNGDCRAVEHEKYYQNRRKRNNEYRRMRRKDDPYYASGTNKEEWVKRSREKYRRIKKEQIERMGGKCSKCGFEDSRALHIDHINGGGGEERNKYGWSYLKMMSKKSLVALLGSYQLLCANCHAIKSYEVIWKK